MAARDIKAGRAFIEVSAELDPLKKALLQGTSVLRSWGESLRSVGATISSVWSMIGGPTAIAALSASVKEFADFGSTIHDMAARTGASAKQLQFLAFAAKQTGAELSDVEMGLRNMARKGRNVADFENIGLAIAAIEDPTKRAAEALAIFGKTGTRLLPMFAELNQLRQASAALGPMLSEEDVNRADVLGDSFGALAEAIGRLKQQVGAQLAGPVTETTNALTGTAAAAADAAHDYGILGSAAIPALRGLVSQNAELSVLVGILDSLTDRGKEAADAAGAMAQKNEELAESLHEASEAAKQRAATQKVLDAAERAGQQRTSLVREFETPLEAFARKQQEIADAIKAVNESSVFVGTTQAEELAALEEAGRRNIRKEAERQGKEFERIGKELEGMAEVARTSARGATGAGAALLGRAAPEFGQVEKQSLDELRKANGHLQNISDRVGPARFS